MFVIKMIRVSEMLHIPFGFVHNLLIQVLIKKEVKLFLEDILVLPKAKPLFCWNDMKQMVLRNGGGGGDINARDKYMYM